MSHGELKLKDGEEDLILDIAVKMTMMYGKKTPSPLSLMLPMWKETPMYERGIFLQRIVFVEYAPNWKVKKKIQSLDCEEWFFGEYDRDFFQGLFDASSRTYKNGTYSRVEFGGRKHLREFLESDVHGQRIIFSSLSKRRQRLNRTKILPFMDIPPKNNLERWFVGAMCGSDLQMVDGEPMMKMKDVCRKRLDRLGVIYSESESNNILVSCFYFMLFMSEMPDFFVSFWMSNIPHKGTRSMRMASLDAAVNWNVINGRKRFQRDAYPFLYDAKQNSRMGISMDEINRLISDKRLSFIDERIRTRCERWETLSQVSAQ